MAIDRLSPTSTLIATLRAGVRRATGEGVTVAESGGSPPRPLSANPRPDVAVLRRQLVDLVRDEVIDDPATQARLRPRVVRAILLWEFGPKLREHPEWQPMLESIDAALAADEGQRRQFAALLADLKRGTQAASSPD
jgi:hypothetical protein